MPILINAYSTLVIPQPLDFAHKLNNRRNLSDPELAEHLDGFSGYVWKISGGKMTSTTYQVLRHIERTRHQISITIEKSDFDKLSKWAWKANVIILMPDGTVCDPSGLIVIAPSGNRGHPHAQLPYPDDAVERKERNTSILKRQGIIVPEGLPPVTGEREVILRRPEEVAKRMLALFVVAVYAESCAGTYTISAAELEPSWPIGFAELSPQERAFLTKKTPSNMDIPIFTWRYESLAVLEWALGLSETLTFPTAICDVPSTARIAIDHNNEDYLKKARLRTTAEILYQLDLHFRIHWAVTDARSKNIRPPKNVEPGVVLERHHALNWLIRFQNADWDNVETPT